MIRVLLHGAWRTFAGGAREVPLEARTLGEALAALARAHPALKERLRDEHGKLRPHLALFVNEEDARLLGGEAAALKDGDIVHVIPALSGGGDNQRTKGGTQVAKTVTLLVGTKKGLFQLKSDADRKKWALEGPYGSPAPIHHASFDPRDRSMYAAINSTWGGSRIEYSRDLGKTWTVGKNPAFPAGSDRTFFQTWHIEPGHAKTPNVVWAGIEPAALFKSEDRGETWSLNTALDDQPSRAKWVPGFGGMGLHSIAIDAADPKFMQIGISVGGVYTSKDGGASWAQDNTQRGGPEDRPDVFGCIHKLLAHPKVGGVRFMRVHLEVYWRDPGETVWTFRTPGLPTSFGFAAAIHPHDPKTAWCIPLHDVKRTAIDPGIAVFKTTDRGATWTRNGAGLPKGAPLESLREGMDNDDFDEVGVYFGTANGDVYASRDEGKSWERIAQYLPYVTSVHAATIA